MQGISQTLVSITAAFIDPICPPKLKNFANTIYHSPLLHRITADWKIALMDCGFVISITCFVFAYIKGSKIFRGALFIVTISSGVGAFYMHKFVNVDLVRENKDLREKLSESHLQMQAIVSSAQEVLQGLKEENLQEGVQELKKNVGKLETHLSSAQNLSTAIKELLSTQGQEFGQKLSRLEDAIAECKGSGTKLKEFAKKIEEMDRKTQTKQELLADVTEKLETVQRAFAALVPELKSTIEQATEESKHDLKEVANEIRGASAQSQQQSKTNMQILEKLLQQAWNLVGQSPSGTDKKSTHSPLSAVKVQS